MDNLFKVAASGLELFMADVHQIDALVKTLSADPVAVDPRAHQLNHCHAPEAVRQ